MKSKVFHHASVSCKKEKMFLSGNILNVFADEDEVMRTIQRDAISQVDLCSIFKKADPGKWRKKN